MSNLDAENGEVLIENGTKTSDQSTENIADDVVTPWSVTSSSATGVDYDKLIC